MASHYRHHEILTRGVGKCGVPMWCNGMPAGFCDEPAYGPQEKSQMRYGEYIDGVWHSGYSSALSCYRHGGPKEIQPLVDVCLCGHPGPDRYGTHTGAEIQAPSKRLACTYPGCNCKGYGTVKDAVEFISDESLGGS